jgi:recombinational DNA repair protein RecR
MVLLGDNAQLERLVSVCLETMLVSVQDTCTVCANRTRGTEIILDKPDGTPR